jgi:serine-type D-Ala-D-Ala endopeptidase (penicillin-binding protein 7)
VAGICPLGLKGITVKFCLSTVSIALFPRVAPLLVLAALWFVGVDAAWAKRTDPRAHKAKVSVVHGQRVIWTAKKPRKNVVAERRPVVSVAQKMPHSRVRKMAVQQTKMPQRMEARRSARVLARSGSRHRVVRVARVARVARVVHLPDVPRHSFGHISGLASTAAGTLELNSSVALVLDQNTNEVLLGKNTTAVLPIASITKLMTALVVTESRLPLQDMLAVGYEDIDTEKGSRSRLGVGVQLTREEMLHLALMSSENRAAHALARHTPGGVGLFVTAMNRRARELGMLDTHYVDPTGLSSGNQSSARDLAVLVKAVYAHQLIRELSTSPEHHVFAGERYLRFRNTNRLVQSDEWDIGLQKTGYISEAGRCLVMQTKLAGRQLIMVFLDSHGRSARIDDAQRVRRWLEGSMGTPSAELGSQRHQF